MDDEQPRKRDKAYDDERAPLTLSTGTDKKKKKRRKKRRDLEHQDPSHHAVARSQSVAYVTPLPEDEYDADPLTTGKGCCSKRVIEVLVFVIFGASGWWSSNAIGQEFPVFVAVVPEKKQLPTLVNVAFQVGNIFPLMYKMISGCCLSEAARRRSVSWTVLVLLLLGCAVLFATAFTWNVTITIPGGTRVSGILLLMSFLAGGIGTTSNVTYWAFATRFPTHCTKALSTGMTFGGLVLSGVILAQNAGPNPHFSAMVYFIVAAALQILMLIAMLPFLLGKSTSLTAVASKDDSLAPLIEDDESESTTTIESGSRRSSLAYGTEGSINAETVKKVKQPAWINNTGLLFCSLCFTIYGMTYALPSMMPYLVGGYDTYTIQLVNTTDSGSTGQHGSQFVCLSENGNALSHFPSYEGEVDLDFDGNSSLKRVHHTDKSSQIYKWALVLQSIGDVAGRISTAIYTPTSSRTLLSLAFGATSIFLLLTVATCFHTQAASSLPGMWGYLIPVVVLCYYFLRGFTVTSIYVWVKHNMSQPDAERLSSNLGMCGQLGALFANGLMLLLTSLKVFG